MSDSQHLSRPGGRHEPPPQPAPVDQPDRVDLDQWLEMTTSDLTGTGDVGPADPAALHELRRRLLDALESNSSSFVPPSAGDLSPEDWDRLHPRARWSLQRAQLNRIDPRLIARTLTAGRRHRAR